MCGEENSRKNFVVSEPIGIKPTTSQSLKIVTLILTIIRHRSRCPVERSLYTT